MKNYSFKTLSFLFLFFTSFFIFFSCADSASGRVEEKLSASTKKVNLKVTNWNVKTFFDSVNDGNEYDEFLSSEKWGKSAYEERIKRLCSVIKALDSDVFVMEEIENEGVLYDISNFLSGEWNSRKVYSYSAFAKDEASCIGCAVLSRFPLENMSLASLDIRTDGQMPKMRPIIRLEVVRGKKSLTLLVNHWKSMSGGLEETEVWRNRQEALLSSIVTTCLENGECLLAAGDFNRDIKNFFYDKKSGQILLRTFENASMQDYGVFVNSPWFTSGGSLVKPGSYYFDGEWSRIDNFFYAGDCKLLSFLPETEGDWCAEEDFIPKDYKVFSGQGYSDHLPVSCVIEF